MKSQTSDTRMEEVRSASWEIWYLFWWKKFTSRTDDRSKTWRCVAIDSRQIVSETACKHWHSQDFCREWGAL